MTNNQPCADLLAVIAQLRERYPNWRFGQLIANIAGWTDQEIWDVEDEQFMEAARQHLQHLESSGTVSSTPAGVVGS